MLSEKLLLDDEAIEVQTRTHVKVLIVPFLVGLAIMLIGGYFAGAVGDSGGGTPRLLGLVVLAVLFLWGTLLPFLRWLTWTYTLTNRRLIEQKGIVTRSGRIIPLARINDVAYEKGVIDRVLRCGTLIIHDASHQSGMHLRDIPRIEEFHRTITRLVLETHAPEARRDEQA
ncbi:PH domain-containing protein [Aeromicrobium sp. 636]|uniref:PH domain-containing protein n=1 Tax=Aeromicrobium senzhongii TaxID=2663859 RepID=A0A8I0EVA4_9ACTN|nr:MULTISPECIES: PH domain-containing protein [Aeromicrobium]MBC9226263.1 PH domain-containing protein [Aeromicrobium senzhongii]MCQ3998369.1 PH domain-containing protein [Aeromicrobium sp. 636]MTB88798.1 PH domain-containing protein [Aeromicrobium senzhongii]QNL93912.1 PH domain-containing protein [Aeromicrobium senzhongii]